MIKTIIFDFDGVILESVSVKTEAFRQLFSDHPDYVDTIVEFHLNNGGMSRFDKFRYIYFNFLKSELNADTLKTLSERFSELVFNGIIACPFVEGAHEFIAENSNNYEMFVVSATPEDELRTIIEQRNLIGYFKGVYGSPTQKEENIKRILSEYRIIPSSVVFIGDARNDWKAAQSTGIHFIARIKPGDPDLFTGLPLIDAKIRDLRDLQYTIRRL